MLIRRYERQDWASAWSILEPIFRTGETYAVPLEISEEDAEHLESEAPEGTTIEREGYEMNASAVLVIGSSTVQRS